MNNIINKAQKIKIKIKNNNLVDSQAGTRPSQKIDSQDFPQVFVPDQFPTKVSTGP